ncbi:Homoaconitase, mitochondrial [Daldinia childiae]|uniref:Homoaconitase, mitochondrial n=1 Tax=Daldinia childiae TaxID=326645 RepID=UPI0014451595|nr:Homoaconitase, mitochondrial [Daldinia childiae]KAF3061440.1 Homoaconitase, mitochondrial [Daldinia childiae]
MAMFRRVISLNASALAIRQARTSIARSRLLSIPVTRFRTYSSTSPRRQQAFQSQIDSTLNSSTLQSSLNSTAPTNPQTLTEKIVQLHADGLREGRKVRAGDYITLRPHKSMTHDNSWPVITKYMEMGATRVNDNRQVVMTLDHDVQNDSEQNLRKYRLIEEFAKKQGIDFYPAKHGIGHQIMIEEGYAWPGTVAVASDSHSNMYGGISCLGTAIVRSDAASVLATSTVFWQVPPIAKITFTGVLPPGVTGKDTIIALCAMLKSDVLNMCVEFTGSKQTLASIPISERLTIANMTTEWGALSGLFPMDDMLISWYRARATIAAMSDSPTKDRINHKRIDELLENPLVADPGATYAKEFYLNLSTLSPFVAGPNSVKVATPVKKLEAQDIAIDKAYLLSCTNGRSTDFAAAARVFREAGKDGKPAKMAEEAGDWQILEQSGAELLPAGCGPCIGLGRGLLNDGEVGISASNRNYKGRMGDPKALCYLASPEVVAASAIQGKIASPGWYLKPEGVEKVIFGEGTGDFVADKARSIGDAFDQIIGEMENMIGAAEGASEESASPVATEDETLTDVLPGFPERIEGEIVFCDNDNINTDGIYPGRYTYQDGLTTEQMAEVCMENYDTEFRKVVKPNDVLVTGFNFGCGSSREQAATSILANKIPLVVAGSFGNIFSRNSINNALLGIEIPKLVERLREAYKDDAEKPLTRRTGWKLLWDVRRSKVVITEQDGTSWEQKVGEMPPSVQEIVAKGGVVKWVQSKMQG